MQSGAYIVRGGVDTVDTVLAYLKKQGIDTEANRDVYVRAYDAFGVGEAHDIRGKALLRAFGDNGRTFVLAMPSITVEAQNALLKILEEPPAGVSFFFVLPTPHTLLPTLMSRAQVLTLAQSDSVSLVNPKTFLKASTVERLEMLKVFFPKKKGEETNDEEEEGETKTKRDIAGAVLFLSALESALYAQASTEKSSSVREGARAIYRARTYMNDKGSLMKSLLEQVALLVPNI